MMVVTVVHSAPSCSCRRIWGFGSALDEALVDYHDRVAKRVIMAKGALTRFHKPSAFSRATTNRIGSSNDFVEEDILDVTELRKLFSARLVLSSKLLFPPVPP